MRDEKHAKINGVLHIGGGRDNSIDIIKGIGICFMVLGHAKFPLRVFINMFHMAIFFMASGYFWNRKNSDNLNALWKYILKKLKSLWLPFVICNIVFLLLNNVFLKMGFLATDATAFDITVCSSSYIGLYYLVVRIVRVIFMLDVVTFGGATWFIRCLFFVNIGHAVLTYLTSKLKYGKVFFGAIVIVDIICATLVVYKRYYSYSCPFRLNACFAAYMAYLMGILLSKIDIKDYINKYRYIVFMISVVILIVFYRFGGISMDRGKIINPIIFVVDSVAGWMMLWSFAMMVHGKLASAIAYLGRESLCIVLWHMLAFKLVIFIYLYITSQPMELLAAWPILDNNPYLWILYGCVGVEVPLAGNALYKKLKFKLLGKARFTISAGTKENP